MNENEKSNCDEMLSMVIELGETIKKKVQELYKDPEKQADFVLVVSTNLLGNLTMQFSKDSVNAKAHLSSVVISNLVEWFGIAIKYYKIKKEAH